MSLYSNGKVFTKEEIEQLRSRKIGCRTTKEEYAQTTGIKGDETLQELIEKYAVPPLGGEQIFDVIGKYGYTFCGICDGFNWTSKLKEVTELDAWKMIALCSIYWENHYKEWLEQERLENCKDKYGNTIKSQD